MGREITFWWDTEKRIRVTRAGKQNSLFYEAYRQAMAGVAEIVRDSVMYENNYDSDPFFPGAEISLDDELHIACDRQYLYDYPNNIIVFSGERGAGKSSAMLTFVGSLKDTKGLLFQNDFLSAMVSCELPDVETKFVEQLLAKCRFVDLPPIDPTTLEDDGQILNVILARMFRMAANIWEDSEHLPGRASAQRLEDKNKLLQKFSTCYEHIQAIKRKGESRPEYEGLDSLAELGDSSVLKVELYQLTAQWLQFCCPEAGKSSYLILQIDDTDMNIKQAYKILEDVRRYLVIPRLIIVMAADLKHLTQVVESSLLVDYNADLDSRHEYVEKITHQYITKLFPQTRQIGLPALGTYFKEHTESVTIRYMINKGPILPDAKWKEFPGPQDQIFRLIYRKTGMVFLKQEHRLHPIIPCNMRLLAHFLSMLIQMDDADDPDAERPDFFLESPDSAEACKAHADKLRTRLRNIQRFRNYFLGTWAANNLNDWSVQILKDLESLDVADRIHYICVQLDSLWGEEDGDSSRPARGDGKAGGDGLYADMMRICQDIFDRSWNEELRLLAFALQTYCSLLAHLLALEDLVDYYDEYAERINRKKKENAGEDTDGDGSQYGKESFGLGCSFSKLYLLFGSRLFSYGYRAAGDSVKVQLSVTGVENPEQFVVSWTSDTPLSVSNLKHHIKLFAMLFYSLLADYQHSGGTKHVCWDLTRPIINCLYLGDFNGETPFSKRIQGAVPLEVKAIDCNGWNSMGNSALTTVLNSDVQMKINAVIQRECCMPDAESPEGDSLEFGKWIARIRALYGMMTEPFQASQPIEFLKHINFSGWLIRVAEDGTHQSEDSEDWKKIVKSLGDHLFYKPWSNQSAALQEPGKKTAEAAKAGEKTEESEASPADGAGGAPEKPATLHNLEEERT